MKVKRCSGLFLLFALIFSLTLALPASNLTLGLHVHGGITIVDVGKATEWGRYVDDWDTFFYGFFAQGFYQLSKLYVGFEFGYSRLYYYYARVPYAPRPIIYEGVSAPMKGLLITQYAITDSIFVQAGAGLHFFDEAAIGLMGSFGYHLKISDKIQIPIFLRTDLILGTGTPIVFSIGSGVVLLL